MSPRARQAKGKARLNAYEELLAQDVEKQDADRGDRDPAGTAPRRRRRRRQGCPEGLRRPAALRRDELLAPAGRDRRRDRPQRGRQDDPLPHDRRPGDSRTAGNLKVGETVLDLLCRPGPRRADARANSIWEEISGGRDADHARQARGAARAPTAPGSASRDPTSRSGRRTSRAASGTESIWPSCSRAAETCSCSTSRPTTSTSTRCARSRTRSIEFAGCAVVISHDRWFLDRIATHILAFEGD